MHKYLATFTIPAQDKRLQIEAPDAGVAAKKLRDLHPRLDNVVINAPVDADEVEESFEVYQWCTVCGLPIWLSDDETTYVNASQVEDEERWQHLACATTEVRS